MTGDADTPAEQQPPRLVRLNGSFEGLGVTIDYLSRLDPYAGYDLGNFTRAVREQLLHGHHVAALAGSTLEGYCGWLPTDRATAEGWVAGTGPLHPAIGAADAAALTIVAAKDRRILTALIRHARNLNPRIRVYFKREYAGLGRPERKNAVDNRVPLGG